MFKSGTLLHNTVIPYKLGRKRERVNVSVRPAGPEDADTVAEMVGELLDEIMQGIGVQAFHFDFSETKKRAGHFMESGVYSVFVATDTSKKMHIGLVTLNESHALYAGGAFGTTPEFYVRHDFRSNGVGKMLLDSAKKYAIAKGWKRLEVATPPVPIFDRTLKFYEANGFTSTDGRKLKVLL